MIRPSVFFFSPLFSFFFFKAVSGRYPRTLPTEKMLRDTMKSWNDSQSDLCSSDQEEEEEMVFGENEDDLEEMMDLSDLPTSLFACSVHEAVFEVQEQKVGTPPVPALIPWEA